MDREMLEAGSDGCKDNILKCASEANCINPNMDLSKSTHKHVQVKEVVTSCPTSEDEVLEVECLLAEPQTNGALDDDDIMHSNSRSTSDPVAIEDYPYTVKYYIQSSDFGISDSDAARVKKQETNYEFVDGILRSIDEEGSLHSLCNFSSVDGDYYLNSGYPESCHLDYASHSGSSGEHLGSDCQTQPLGKDGTALEKPALSHAISYMPESASDQSALLLDKLSTNELHDVFRDMFGMNTCVMDKQWLKHRILFGLQNLIEIDNASKLLGTGLSSTEKEDSMILIPGNYLAESIYSSFTIIPDSTALIAGSDVGKRGQSIEEVAPATYSEVGRIGHAEGGEITITTSKRLRKPTRRYMEETTAVKSRCSSERLDTAVVCCAETFSHVRTDRQCNLKGVRPTVMFYQDCPVGSDIQLPCGLRTRRGRPRKNMTPMGNDSRGTKTYNLRPFVSRRSYPLRSQSQDDMSDDNSSTTRKEKIGVRRKHHRQWTLSEVMKLVDGVTQYGVGRWTDIKRLLFSASAYRTSVDLKDKWRNLLRASGAQFNGRTKIEAQKKHMTLPIPQSVLHQIRQLAIIHPYPRERKSRPAVAVMSVGASSHATSISHCGKTSRKLSFA